MSAAKVTVTVTEPAATGWAIVQATPPMQAFHSDAHRAGRCHEGHRFPQAEVPPAARAACEAAPGLIPAAARSPSRPAPGELALVHDARLCGGGAARVAFSAGACSARSASPGQRSHGRAIAATRWAPPSLAARAALAEGRGRQSGWRHSPCLCADKGSRLLRLQRCGGGRAPDAGRSGIGHDAPAPRAGCRSLVIDLDVHQGNGTAAIFRDDPTACSLSRMHGEKNFPFRKEPERSGCRICRTAVPTRPIWPRWTVALEQVWARHRGAMPPGLAFYLAGADPHEGRSARPAQTQRPTACAERDRRVLLGAAAIDASRSPWSAWPAAMDARHREHRDHCSTARCRIPWRAGRNAHQLCSFGSRREQ